MIRTKDDFTESVRSNLKGGIGDIKISEFVHKSEMTNCRLLCEQRIPVGGSIGKHIHENETEFYIIKKGSAKVYEDSGCYSVGEGDVVITGHNEMHSIENTSNNELIIIAIIVTH